MRDGLQWHEVHTTFPENLSVNSNVIGEEIHMDMLLIKPYRTAKPL
jgi:hypothetical protein